MIQDIYSHAAALGLLTDIAGALFISKSVFYKRNKSIFNTSAGFLGYSRINTLDAIVAKREALFGCLLLVMGFLGQLKGVLRNESINNLNIRLIIVYIFILILTSVAAMLIIRKWSERNVDKLVKEYQDK
ncbi:MAG TPA: hypothetical protein VF572_00895 [Candidatus Saccharimonadales bacterium]|jgi:multisubunit Na+/H+ antiporter MnhG subunit